jgi:hypothetical protein
MSTRQKERPSHWMVALVPIFGDVRVGGTLRPRWREAILIGNDATADERRSFYEALLEMKWLPPKARSAIAQEQGSSLRKQKFDDEKRRMMRLEYQVKTGMRTHREIAAGEGIKVAALKQEFQRFRKRERLGMKEIARLKKKIARLQEAGAGKREK